LRIGRLLSIIESCMMLFGLLCATDMQPVTQ
jgi:hypothetical protein